MKKIPQTLALKLKTYSGFAAAVLTVHEARSQVIYTDINPDKHYGYGYDNNTFSLNLDMEGPSEISITADHYFSSVGGYSNTTSNRNTVFLSIDPSNFVCVSSHSGGFKLPEPMLYGEWINYENDWKNSVHMEMAMSAYEIDGGEIEMNSTKGWWLNGVTDGYMGFKMLKAGEVHFGWLRLDVDSTNNSFTVKDYAYQVTPGAAIMAGQMTTAIHNGLEPSIHVTNNLLYIDGYSGCSITLIMINGQLADQRLITSNITDLSNLEKGIYILRIWRDGELLNTRKIIIG